jgi:hypothetical protein
MELRVTTTSSVPMMMNAKRDAVTVNRSHAPLMNVSPEPATGLIDAIPQRTPAVNVAPRPERVRGAPALQQAPVKPLTEPMVSHVGASPRCAVRDLVSTPPTIERTVVDVD